jgi:hypothetical protein
MIQRLSERPTARRYVYLAVIVTLLVVAAVYLALLAPGQQGGSSAASATSTTGSTTTKTSATGTSPISTEWLTYHHDNQRTGLASPVTAFTTPLLRWTFPPDQAVYAEPLVYEGAAFVATENDSVYSISLSDETLNWRTNLGVPLPGSALPCGDIDPVGITGTPAIDPSSSTLYVVAMLKSQGYSLFALSTASGHVRWSVSLSRPGFDYHVQQERGALALANGLVYIPFGGFTGDCGNYHGWVMGYPTNGTGKLLSYQVPSTREAGIWSTGGVVVTSGGWLYVTTGNSESTSTFDFGESVIRLNPNLTVDDYFAPSNWASLNEGDTDLGSLSPVYLGNGLLFQAGKEGVGYLLNESHLGGIGGQLYSAHFCSSAFGAGAFDGPYPIIPCTDGLYRLAVSSAEATSSFTVNWSQTGFYAGPPIIAYGAVWVVDIGNGTLFALDEGTGHSLFHLGLGAVVHFTTPAAGEGFVVVAATNTIYCFQLGS